MVMKNLYKECLVSIRKSYKKFLAIILIVLLGVGFFVGIRATSPDMRATLDKYFHEYQMYDVSIMSNYGITVDEIEKIRDKGYDIWGAKSVDVVVNNDDNEYAVKVISYDKNSDVNQLKLIKGSLPNSRDECVIEENEYTNHYAIGDTIYIEDDSLKDKNLKIVGIVESPLYISNERGSTKVLAGKINYYLYSNIDNFNTDIYTEAFIDIDNDNSYFSDDYKKDIDKERNKIKNIVSKLGSVRYQDMKDTYQEKIDDYEREYNNSYNYYSNILNSPYTDSVTKSKINSELDKAKKDIDNAKTQLENLEEFQWYVLGIDSNIGFYSYQQDTVRINNIAKVFPVVFFVVAILICLTTMTRMVEEERSQIGTLKSLGYSDSSICFKYVLYAMLATISGSLIGALLGFNIIPRIIFMMYQMMYTVNNFQNNFYWGFTLLGIMIAFGCTVGATIYTCIKTLREVPAELLRPKAPKAGKRVWLEYIPFIWNRLKFTNKVTARNVFRYKKRMCMTIIGIAGCTGLILAGFGLKDCITTIVPNQYEDIFKYQVEVTLKDECDENTRIMINEELEKMDEVNDYLAVQKEAIEINGKDTKNTITLVVPFGDIHDFIDLRDRKSKKSYELGKGVIITEKIAQLLEINSGDKLILNGDKQYQVQVADMTENYLDHYIYMNKKLYSGNDYNTIFLKTDKMSEREEKQLSNKLKNIDGVSSLMFNSNTRGVFNSAMDNFSYVSMVLIVSAGMLAFVVLYNLASVNISERNREMATIKVLGFYDREVYNYIGRESSIFTVIGILLGMVIGQILTSFIIKTCEVDMLMFAPVISFKSYIYSALITLCFTIIVDIATYFALKKIDMISSLKSVE